MIQVELADALFVLPVFNGRQNFEANTSLLTKSTILSEAFVQLQEFPTLLAMSIKQKEASEGMPQKIFGLLNGELVSSLLDL